MKQDDLVTYDRAWDQFLRWRKGHGKGGRQSLVADPPAGSGVNAHARIACLENVPMQIRDEVARQLDSTIEDLVVAVHRAYKLSLMREAIAEARDTLGKLEPLEQIMANAQSRRQTPASPPIDCDAEVERLGAAVGGIGEEEP